MPPTMEGSAVHAQAADRPRPTFPRTASRSSTSSSNTRMTPISANSSRSHLPPSPQQSTAHPIAHPFRRRTSSRGAADLPRSQLSRETSDDARQPVPQVSSFLQERLQRERKVESERSSSRMSNDPMSASLDLRAIQSSPARSGTSDSRRPRSSGGPGPAKKKGLGLKEMEQVSS